MDNKSILPTTTTTASSEQSKAKQSRCSKGTICVAVCVLVCLVAVAVTAAAITMVVDFARGEGFQPHELDLETKEKAHSMILQAHTEKRSVANQLRASCHSDVSNETRPIAEIAARGTKWGTREPPRTVPDVAPNGYQARWHCSASHGNSFVKGGMNFSQDDQRLYFPTCGYYHISSQVVFQYSSENNEGDNQTQSVQHSVEVRPNCRAFDTFFRYSHSTLIRKEAVRTSTYIGDVVRICEGGSIRVIIPVERNICCARGDSQRTYFSAFLVQEIDCPNN